MKTRENIIIVERVMQKTVPDREVKVTITITELCKFIQAAREDEACKAPKSKGQYEDIMDTFRREKASPGTGPSRKSPFDTNLFRTY